jgi:hypothetical protein
MPAVPNLLLGTLTRRWMATSVVSVMLGIFLATVGMSQAYADGANSGPLAIDGVVSFDAGAMHPLAMDLVHRRLYTITEGSQPTLEAYDLDRPYRQMLVDRRAFSTTSGSYSNYFIAPDVQTQRAYVLDFDTTDPTCPACSLVRVLDLKQLKMTPQVWNLSNLVPNFFGEGITYSAADHRIYITGSIIGYSAFSMSVAPGPYYPMSIMAIDIESGKMAWFKTLTKCLRPMSGYNVGAGIFRSARYAALYVACARADTNPIVGAQYFGHTGVVRLSIDPTTNTSEAAAAFPEQFFETSGGFSSARGAQARTAFDYASDRFFIVSASVNTPGIWVFDGGLSAWVGFVPAATESDMGLGVDPLSGRVYSGDGSGQILVTDGRATPVPQGKRYSMTDRPSQPDANMTYLVDPATHRVFLNVFISQHVEFIALKDSIPSDSRDEALDFDRLTNDVAESPDTVSTYAGDATGFGAHVVAVGGLGGASSPARPGIAGILYSAFVGQTPGVSPGDRGLWMSRSGADVRNSGATASARAITIDNLTDDTRGSLQQQVADTNPTGEARDPKNPSVEEQAAGGLSWPWPQESCLDPGDSPDAQEANDRFGAAKVECDLSKPIASVKASAPEFGLAQISIAKSSFDGKSERNAAGGIVATATAQTTGVKVHLPGYGELDIADIKQTAVTSAHGRPGTTSVTWSHAVDGVKILNASGQTQFSCEKNCDPEAVATQVNDLLGLQMHMTVPKPEMLKTPKGAFAGFQENYSQYINDLIMNNDDSRAMPLVQLEVYNDWADKSRMMMQFAAVQASSIYTISSLGGFPSDESLGAPTFVVPPAGLMSVPPSNPPGVAASPPPSLSVGQQIYRSALLLVRSPKAAAAVCLMGLWIGGLIALAIRRRALGTLLMSGQSR